MDQYNPNVTFINKVDLLGKDNGLLKHRYYLQKRDEVGL